MVAIVSAGPPAAFTFLSRPSAKNPTHCPSGDQNGNPPTPSVPGRARGIPESIARIHSKDCPEEERAANAIRVPSGDGTGATAWSCVPSGAAIVNRAGRCTADGPWFEKYQAVAAAETTMAAATAAAVFQTELRLD